MHRAWHEGLNMEEDVREAGQRFLDEHTIKKLWHP